MIKIAICDDENTMINIIEDMLDSIAKEKLIKTDISVFSDGAILEKSFLAGEKYDIIYLDIQMEEQDGLVTAKNIRKMDKNVLIIYVSGYGKYLYELFELEAFEFITKPINPDKFERCFLRAYDRLCSYAIYYEFQYKNESIKIPIGEILYFESKGRKIHIHLLDGSTDIFNGKLNDVETKIKFSKMPFLRIHQSYLVSYHYIKARSNTHIRMKNEDILPISEERKKDIGKQYGKLLGGDIDD